jgi:hypothetical protein
MSSITLTVIKAPDKWLATICWPKTLIIELGRIPHGLVGELGHSYRVGRWAGTSVLERTLDSVVHVVLMVRAIKVLAIPASREMMDGHYARGTRVFGEIVGLTAAGHNIFQAGIAEAGIATLGSGRAANGHAEALQSP